MSCLFVTVSPPGVVRLMRGHVTTDSVREWVVEEGEYPCPGTMAVKRPVAWREANHLVRYLSQCLLEAEHSVAAVTFDKVTVSVYGCHGDADDHVDVQPRILPAFKAHHSSSGRHGNKMMRTEGERRFCKKVVLWNNLFSYGTFNL